MVDTIHGAIFARLLFLFTITIQGATYPIALIHPYDAAIGARKRKERDLDLYAIRAKPRSSAEFISARSIIRGVPLAPTFDSPDEYYVMDNIDPDMFLRMEELRQQRI